jgi:AcrR family transcriptional regulator
MGARYHHGDLRAVLTRAAADAIATGGVNAISFRALARSAGVSSGAPFHHFRDKSELVAIVAAEGFALLHERLRSVEQRFAPRRRRARRSGALIDALIAAYLAFAREERGYYAALFAPEAILEQNIAHVEPGAMGCFAVVTNAVSRERPGLSADEAQDIAIAVWACVHGFCALEGPGPLARKASPKRAAELASRAVRSIVERM